MTRRRTINIIGAGPASLTAAIVLRRHGFAVKVFEAAPDVGHRLNGDFQGLENWSSEKDVTEQLREIGIGINFLCMPYHEGTVYAPGLDPVDVKSDRPIFYLVRRGDMPGTLDWGLKEQALALGVEIAFKRRVDSIEGRAIVGTGPKGADAVAVGMTFNTQMQDRAAVVLDDEIAPKGYAYLLVKQGYGTMAAVLYRDFKKADAYLEKTLAFFTGRMDLDMENTKKFGGYGNFFLRDSQMRNEKLYVGEAAGFQDCLWGFGMRYAMLSGYAAARSIMDGEDYDTLWQRELRPGLESSLVNRYLFERIGHAGYRLLTRCFGRGDPAKTLKRLYRPSLLKRLLLPLASAAYESSVRDLSCSREDCRCVWCRCGTRACP